MDKRTITRMAKLCSDYVNMEWRRRELEWELAELFYIVWENKPRVLFGEQPLSKTGRSNFGDFADDVGVGQRKAKRLVHAWRLFRVVHEFDIKELRLTPASALGLWAEKNSKATKRQSSKIVKDYANPQRKRERAKVRATERWKRIRKQDSNK